MEREVRWAALMAAAQRGDETAYATILRDCIPLIRSVAFQTGVPPSAADDVVQEVLLAVHRARATYDPRLPFTPWLRTIAQRRAIDLLRTAGRAGRRELHSVDAVELYPDASPSALQTLDSADQGGRLRAAVAGLPDGQRQAVELLGLQEMTLAEAATLTGRTKTALKVNLHRALKALRQRLVDHVGS